MPYNTRRKSVSLELLGIHVPQSSRSSSHRSPPSAHTGEPQPPSKRRKQSHASSASLTSPSSPPRSTTIRFQDERSKNAARAAQNTPPPSPGRDETGGGQGARVDTEGINDDIVVGVIEQLEKTGNRPHSLKELAAVLATTLPSVQSSANPAAIISSRLLAYLRRTWTALAPCPVASELVEGHPKKLYYYLTSTPRQAFPTGLDTPSVGNNRIISPSLSSAADEEERDARARTQLSPSPEVDLSSPEFEDVGAPFSSRNPLMRDVPHSPTATNIISHNRRAQSPQLEGDEREFTQTASSLQRRRQSEAARSRIATEEVFSKMDCTVTTTDLPVLEQLDESPETAARRNMETAAALFGQAAAEHGHLAVPAMAVHFSSPELRPQHLELHIPSPLNTKRSPAVLVLGEDRMELEDEWKWSELKSPENVELDELEDMFGGY